MTPLTQDQRDALEQLKQLAENGLPMGAVVPVGLDLSWLTQLLPILSIVFPQIAPFIPIIDKLLPVLLQLIDIFNTQEGQAALAAV